MTTLFYQLVLSFFRLVLPLFGLVNPKTKAFIDGRKGQFNRMQAAFDQNSSPVAWFHAASLGEFEQGRPVIEKYRQVFPNHKILLTFFSPSGYEVRKNYKGADFVFYLPFDFASNARKFIAITNPTIAFFIKYEFWPMYLKSLHERGVPIISFSAIFREKQLFFKWYGSFYRKVLRYFAQLFVQQETSQKLLNGIGIEQVTVSGDTRFDRVWEICSNPMDIPIAKSFKNNELVMVLGSVWPDDIKVILPFLKELGQSQLKFIIAPHNIHLQEIKELESILGLAHIRYSEAKEDLSTKRVLIVDNVGMLSSLYQYGEMAYIGGAYSKGLHNTLEAATFGVPIFVGKSDDNNKFEEVEDMQRLGGLIAISNANNLTEKVSALLHDEPRRKAMGKLNAEYVAKNVGATDQILNYVKEILPQS